MSTFTTRRARIANVFGLDENLLKPSAPGKLRLTIIDATTPRGSSGYVISDDVESLDEANSTLYLFLNDLLFREARAYLFDAEGNVLDAWGDI